ncbi:tRNA (adenosine(37)-N6)-threonylcarbamoyltransferase complex ATPase subunit type 1 TsaE [Hydrogenimonas sp.]
MKTTLHATLDEIDSVAKKISKLLRDNSVVFLRGDLAAGKTTLTKALANAKGCSNAVTSPTFSIQQIYDGGLHHYDLYQCPNEKFMAMGLLESLEEPGWHIIEWGDEALEELLRDYGFDVAVVDILPEEKGRRYEVKIDGF